MQLYLIRHTTPDIAKGICYGQTDLPLNLDLFKQECTMISSKLPDHIDQFYSSPLSRCLQLANSLSSAVLKDEQLMEMNFGDWEMQPWTAIAGEPLNRWMSDFVNEPTPGGENYLALHQRTTAFINKLLVADPQSAAIITHAGNIRSLISWALDLPLENSFRINLNYGAVIKLTINTDKQYNQIHF